MKIKVKDISFKQYIELDDRMMYDYYLEYGDLEPEDKLDIGEFTNQSFGFVKDMQYYASIGITWDQFFETISEITGKNYDQISELSLFDLHKTILFCIEQVKKINKMEIEYLGHKTTSDEERADIARFNDYGSFIQFDKLANGDVLKFDEIKALNYNFCFTKLKLDADRDNYIEDYQTILRNKK